MEKIKVLCVCGTGIATSTMLVSKVLRGLSERGIDAEGTETSILDLEAKLKTYKPTIIVYSASVEGVEVGDVKVFNGLSILYNMNAKKTLDEIANYLKNM